MADTKVVGIAMYSEKFMPDFSSIAPSSMVRAPIAPDFNCDMNVCLPHRQSRWVKW